MQSIIFERYRSGVNLGGWISQCRYEKEHIAHFITQPNIAQIASWGVDHIRLPFDYPVLEDDAKPYVYHEDGFAVIDSLIEWCNAHHLNVVLDMHKAPGYAFYSSPDEQQLFTDAETQNRFFSLWEAFAKRYKSEGDNVIFELMNEITDPRGNTWNEIAKKAVARIRSIDANRYILLGGPNYNAASSLDSLELYDDERILYNFHFYEPFMFTHQCASWTFLKDTHIRQPYPGKIEGIDELNRVLPEIAKNPAFKDTVFDRRFLEDKLSPAIKFMERTGKRLYCGEYGPIDHADLNSRVNWVSDVTALFNEHKIGKAYWSYKGMNFTTIDKQGKPVSEALIKAIAVK